MRDVGICVGLECRLAKKKKKITKNKNRCDDAKDAGRMHTHLFFLFFSPVQSNWRKDTSILWAPRHLLKFNQTQAGLHQAKGRN